VAEDRKRVLWHSNAPWCASGYGTQTALFIPALAQLGYEVALSAFYGLHGAVQEWQSGGERFRVYPAWRDPWGSDVIGAHSDHWFAGERGITITLTDPWVLRSDLVARLPCAAWIPVDHEPLITRTDDWLRETNAIPIAMSHFGEKILRAAKYDPLYLPHSFDSGVYRVGNQRKARTKAKLPLDAFIVGMVAANQSVPSRKGFVQAFQAFKAFHARHKDAILYVHTLMKTPEGENLERLVEMLKIRPLVPQQYLFAIGMAPEKVADLMRGFDVLLHPAHGEGFGLPLIEAAACGTPSVTTNFSANPEVAGPAAILVDGQREFSMFESWQVCPDIEGLVEGLELIYTESADERAARRELAATHALGYNMEAVQPLLADMMVELVERLDWRDRKRGSKAER
jgi:glycosyltransferase involved in cell wall biosynthesis